MSLDVMLRGKMNDGECRCSTCDNVHVRHEAEEIYSANITHNLGKMANEAGIYKHLWRPEELGITKASQLVEPLERGLALMKEKPAHFKQFNAPNGWGLYEHFIPWIEDYVDACRRHPDASVHISR